MKRTLLTAIIFMTLTVTHLLAQTGSFTFTPQSQSLSGATATFYVKFIPQGGFNASVYLTVRVPSLPAAKITVTPGSLNPPFTDSAAITITVYGPKTPGTHAIIIEGKNGPLNIIDSCLLEITGKPAWQVYNTSNSPLVTNKIRGVSIDRDGHGWVNVAAYNWIPGGYYGEGVQLLSFAGTDWTEPVGTNLPFGDSAGTICAYASSSHSVVFDSIGGVWMASDSGGISLRNGIWKVLDVSTPNRWKDPLPSWYDSTMGARLLLSGARRRIAIDHNGNLWIAGYEKLVRVRIDDINDFNSWSYPNSSPQGDWFLEAIAIDHNNNVWVARRDSAVAKFDGTYWTSYPEAIGSVLAIDSANQVWVAGNGTGVTKIADPFMTVYQANATGFPGPNPTTLAIDQRGIIWTGNHDGVGKFDGTTFDFYTIENSGLPFNDIISITVDQNNYVWIGTNGGGLAILDGNQSGYVISSGVPGPSLAERSTRMIEGIYPNPATGSSSLRLSVAEGGMVHALLLNQLGQQVATPLDGYLPAGEQVLPLDLSSLPNGVYYLRVTAGEVTETRRVVVMH